MQVTETSKNPNTILVGFSKPHQGGEPYSECTTWDGLYQISSDMVRTYPSNKKQ